MFKEPYHCFIIRLVMFFFRHSLMYMLYRPYKHICILFPKNSTVESMDGIDKWEIHSWMKSIEVEYVKIKQSNDLWCLCVASNWVFSCVNTFNRWKQHSFDRQWLGHSRTFLTDFFFFCAILLCLIEMRIVESAH